MAFRTYSTLLVTLLVTIATVCSQDVTVTVTPEVQYIDEGLEFDFTCQISSPVLSGNGENVALLKRQTPDEDPLLLGYGSVIFQSGYLNRMQATPIPSDDGHVIGLAVKTSGALPQDSGEFGCVKVTNTKYEGEPAYGKVYIKKQVQTLQMYGVARNGTEYPLENGKSYQLTQKEDLRLKCRATGSVPAAHVTAMLGLQDISKQLFHQTSETVLVQEGGSQMNIYAYNTVLISNKSIDIQVPQSVSCQAQVEGVEGTKTFTIYTMFKHAPVIDCETKVTAVNEKDVSLDCRLSSDPAIDKLFWIVRLPTGVNITITDDTDHSSYSSQTEHNGNHTSTKLFINRIFKNHFHNQYFLFAQNTEGATQVEAVLEGDPNAGEVGSVASTLAASAFLFFTAALLRLL